MQFTVENNSMYSTYNTKGFARDGLQERTIARNAFGQGEGDLHRCIRNGKVSVKYTQKYTTLQNGIV